MSSKDCAAVIFFLADKCTKVANVFLIYYHQDSLSFDCFHKMALDTIQILGGNGYLNDYPAGVKLHYLSFCGHNDYPAGIKHYSIITANIIKNTIMILLIVFTMI